MSYETELLRIAIQLAQDAGHILLSAFGESLHVSKKGDNNNIVTEIDARSEQYLVDEIHRLFPAHSVIAEETGCDLRNGDYTWIIDPLDGTSNYAAGVPWFGILICIFRGKDPLAGIIYTPVTGDIYSAIAGRGAYRNSERISVAQKCKLEDVLWAYGSDGETSDEEAAYNAMLWQRLSRRVRNIRATNSLIDSAYTADGRLGGVLNLHNRLWDIAAPALLVQEAGGRYTDLHGKAVDFDLSANAAEREYAILGGAPDLHREVVALVRDAFNVKTPARSSEQNSLKA